MELQVVVPGKADPVQTIDVSDVTFDQKFNETLVHQVVTSYLAGKRQGSHAQKNRSAVRGGGKKPWRQKGTGRARAGTIRSPIWRGGGVTFAATKQDYSNKVNKKMYKVAIRSILSELIRQERLIVVESISIDEAKTKELAKLLKEFSLSNVLIITEQADEKINLAARNIINIDVKDAISVDPVSLVKFEKVLITSAAVKKLEERLA